jgi:hypothetical protein
MPHRTSLLPINAVLATWTISRHLGHRNGSDPIRSCRPDGKPASWTWAAGYVGIHARRPILFSQLHHKSKGRVSSASEVAFLSSPPNPGVPRITAASPPRSPPNGRARLQACHSSPPSIRYPERTPRSLTARGSTKDQPSSHPPKPPRLKNPCQPPKSLQTPSNSTKQTPNKISNRVRKDTPNPVNLKQNPTHPHGSQKKPEPPNQT